MRLIAFHKQLAESLAIYRSGADSAAARKGDKVPGLHNIEHTRWFKGLLEAERLFCSNARWF